MNHHLNQVQFKFLARNFLLIIDQFIHSFKTVAKIRLLKNSDIDLFCEVSVICLPYPI